jgi:hypothetical protein
MGVVFSVGEKTSCRRWLLASGSFKRAEIYDLYIDGGAGVEVSEEARGFGGARAGGDFSKRRVRRPYAMRKPKEYKPLMPGDLVEVDTVDIRPLLGVLLKQFMSRDVISRGDVVAVRSRATAHTAMEFIETIQRRMLFAVRAI